MLPVRERSILQRDIRGTEGKIGLEEGDRWRRVASLASEASAASATAEGMKRKARKSYGGERLTAFERRGDRETSFVTSKNHSLFKTPLTFITPRVQTEDRVDEKPEFTVFFSNC